MSKLPLSDNPKMLQLTNHLNSFITSSLIHRDNHGKGKDRQKNNQSPSATFFQPTKTHKAQHYHYLFFFLLVLFHHFSSVAAWTTGPANGAYASRVSDPRCQLGCQCHCRHWLTGHCQNSKLKMASRSGAFPPVSHFVTVLWWEA